MATIIQNKTTEEDAPPFLLDGGSYSAFSQVHPPMQHSFPFPLSFPGREWTPLLVWAAQKVKLPSSPPICFPLTPKFSPSSSSLGRFSLPCEGERRSTGEEHPSLPFRPTAHTFGAEGWRRACRKKKKVGWGKEGESPKILSCVLKRREWGRMLLLLQLESPRVAREGGGTGFTNANAGKYLLFSHTYTLYVLAIPLTKLNRRR